MSEDEEGGVLETFLNNLPEPGRAWASATLGAMNLPGETVDDGEVAVSPEMAKETVGLLVVAKGLGMQPPTYVYGSPGGTPVVEWHFDGGVALVAHVRTAGEAEVVLRCPRYKPVIFTVPVPPTR
jgi:hypothetical protein